MCFGGGGSKPNPNIKPAPYALDQAGSQVEKTVSPAGQSEPADGGMVESTAPRTSGPDQINPQATGLTVPRM